MERDVYKRQKLYDHPQDMTEVISDYLQHNVLKDLRITVVNLDGKVLFDSQEQNVEQLGNHLDREEVQKALYNGVGFDVRRTSETTGVPYFYSATLYKEMCIRDSHTAEKEAVQVALDNLTGNSGLGVTA